MSLRQLDDQTPDQEFDCVECGRHIIRFCGRMNEPALCAQCIFMPGWFRDARVRELFDPEHDGKEVIDRGQ